MFNMNYKKLVSMVTIVLLIFSLSIIVKPSKVFACDCIGPGTPNEELARSTAVFSGKVISINRSLSGYAYNVTFDVEKIWKGVSEKNIVVSTSISGASCGFGFKEGEKYIVYANGEKSLSAGLCSRTHLLTQADTDISVLGVGKSPTSGIELTTKKPSNFSPSTTTFGIIVIVLVLLGIIYKIIASRKKLS